jgi:catechol 2,3-dioxygenase-like lactoylglutathione lyase family enzyme
MPARAHALILLVLSTASFVIAEEKPAEKDRGKLKIALTSVFVTDQEKALKFYTETLGFVKKFDVPVGKFKWLTVVSAEEPNGTELLLEPNDNPTAKTYQEALFKQGIPAKVFAVEDIQKEFQRLKKLGVIFKTEPTNMGPVTIAVLDDTCGNLIQIMQPAQK